MTIASLEELAQSIRNVPDFPKPGIQFKDITPVLASGRLFDATIHHLLSDLPAGSVDKIVGIDARGFIFGAAAAHRLGAGFVPVRKKGKLPWDTHEQSYDLEYGSSTVAVHTDAVAPGERILLVDDLLATGGTAAACAELVERVGGELCGLAFVVELADLNGRAKLPAGVPVESLIVY